NALGVARHGLGDVPGAIEALEAGEALQADVEDAEAWGRILVNLGAAYLAAEQPEKAEAAYRDGLVRLEEAGVDARVVAQAWRGLGRAQLALGGLVHERRAVESHGRSLEIFEAEGDRSEMAVSLNLMGHASLARYKWSEALGSFRQALALWEGLGDRRGMAVASNGMGQTFYEKEEYEHARKYFEQDLAHSRAAKDEAGVARALSDLGRAHAALRSWERAGETYDEALAIRGSIGDRRGEALVHWGRAHMAFSREDRDGAVSEMERAVQILRELEDRDLERAERHLSRMRHERPGPWIRYL
ncbi:MAG: tetratricopeptide repeat protein, partial [Acidobacteriota bacterium]